MKKVFLLMYLSAFLFLGCSSDDEGGQAEPTVELNNEVNDFVWKAMNYWYFWQNNVTNLDDTKDDNINDYYTYLNGFSDSENLFESLKSSEDDFSWFIPNVDDQLNSFRGISESYGIRLPTNFVRVEQGSDDLVIFVAYVVPGSAADLAGVERGDLIYKVNGSVLNVNNASLINKLFSDISISLGVANFDNGVLTPKGEDISLTATVISENPVHFSSIIDEGGRKFGYLVYNAFRSTYHQELNDVFANFKASGINELILDLRYNRGGSVLTSAYLSSMIDGNQSEGNPFASLTYNQKRNAQNGVTFPFYDEAALFNKETGRFEGNFISMNRLTNLTRVYVLTTGQTASASEMIINGLRPTFGEQNVIIVGTKTVGKNEGSITLVDAPATSEEEIYTNIEGRTNKHTIGMQPIVFQIFNSLNQNDYDDGFPANVLIDEIQFSGNILPFGDRSEPLLSAAIGHALNDASKSSSKPLYRLEKSRKIKKEKFSDALFILPGEEKFANQTR